MHVLAPDAAYMQTLASERRGVGYRYTPGTNLVQPEPALPGSLVCVATDGFTDQIGGPKRIAFGKNRLRATMLAHRRAGIRDFTSALANALRGYESTHRRRDDVTLFCARL